jgi:SAM-dependent methyltransferase
MTTASRARSFDAWAAEYDHYRPGYPGALFDEIAARLDLPEHPRVVDLGAGTGLATLAMAARGWRMTAVEPGAPMLSVLRERAVAGRHSVTPVQASAEATGLDDASFDLASAAQAFHWFDHAAAVAEMARIVRPGGGIALFWNVRDAAVSPLVADYNALFEAYGIGADSRLPGRHPDTQRWIVQSGAFTVPVYFQVPNIQSVSRDEFIGLALTKSYVRAQDNGTQRRFIADLEALLGRHGDGSDRFEIPYLVDCEIARRIDR